MSTPVWEQALWIFGFFGFLVFMLFVVVALTPRSPEAWEHLGRKDESAQDGPGSRPVLVVEASLLVGRHDEWVVVRHENTVSGESVHYGVLMAGHEVTRLSPDGALEMVLLFVRTRTEVQALFVGRDQEVEVHGYAKAVAA